VKGGGKGYDALSGRALFTYDPSLFVDDADAVDDLTIQSDPEDEEDQQGQQPGRAIAPAAAAAAEAAGREEEVAINEAVFAEDDDVPDEE